jgi:N-glycosylase/DNA lyase
MSTSHPNQEDHTITEEMHHHPFPSPQALAQEGVEQRLRELGFGYRAKYIAQTAKMLCEAHGFQPPPLDQEERPKKRLRKTDTSAPGESSRFGSVHDYLHSLRSISYVEAKEELIKLPGIGPKVAECVLSVDVPRSVC